MIAIVDYGAGNLTSVRKAFAAIGAEVFTPSAPAELARARGVVVPGVGHFEATSRLDGRWREAIGGCVEAGVPLLGICVGLQWLFEGSTEAPGVPGLGVFPGVCDRLRPGAAGANDDGSAARPALKVPHVGWNTLTCPWPSRLLAGIEDGVYAYFTHAYAAPVVADTSAVCEHGVPFSAAVERGQVAGVQFHPEKSGDVGLRVLRNWVAAP